jgi:hypothetical protein
MGREQLAALAKIIEEQLKQGTDSALVGSWTIEYDAARGAFSFGKCEFGTYCEERPAVVSLDGNVIDRGGPLFPADA